MALVDYSSDSASSRGEAESPADAQDVAGATTRSLPPPPPLPSIPVAFHDLYASTVRPSTHDNPSLHHGRTRQIPHIAGNWPSHVYVEWYPSADDYDLLNSLVSTLRSEVWGEDVGDDGYVGELHSFLTSDLSTPLPLHISLSQPFVLTGGEKSDFLERLSVAIRQKGGIERFSVRPHTLSWHRSPDSNRAFLVLQVREAGDGNAGLTSLVSTCNGLLRRFGQPPLYPASDDVTAATSGSSSSSEDAVLDKFHVSIAWALTEVTKDLRSLTTAVYERDGFSARVGAVEIPVNCVKVKIGNVVSSLALPDGRRPQQTGRPSLLS